MKVFNLICAEQVSIEDGVGLSIKNPITSIELPTIPNNYSMNVLFSISEYDTTETQILRLLIKFQEDIIFDSDFLEFKQPGNLLDDTGEEEFIVGNLAFDIDNIELLGTGMYTVEVQYEGEKVAESYFYVTTSNKEGI